MKPSVFLVLCCSWCWMTSCQGQVILPGRTASPSASEMPAADQPAYEWQEEMLRLVNEIRKEGCRCGVSAH